MAGPLRKELFLRLPLELPVNNIDMHTKDEVSFNYIEHIMRHS